MFSFVNFKQLLSIYIDRSETIIVDLKLVIISILISIIVNVYCQSLANRVECVNVVLTNSTKCTLIVYELNSERFIGGRTNMV